MIHAVVLSIYQISQYYTHESRTVCNYNNSKIRHVLTIKIAVDWTGYHYRELSLVLQIFFPHMQCFLYNFISEYRKNNVYIRSARSFCCRNQF